MTPARARRALVYGMVLLALAAVMALYAQPDFMVQMVNLVWACF